MVKGKIMRLIRSLILVFTVVAAACVSFPPRSVSVVGPQGEIYVGTLTYHDAWSGTLKMPAGPGEESYEGLFVVVDRTATSQSQGTIVGSGVVGTASGAATAELRAAGTWHAKGSGGSTMICQLEVGRLGHGVGTCEHSNGDVFRIAL